jgi:hypothetical protein
MKRIHVILIAVFGALALSACETTYGFDPVAVGSDQTSTPRPRSSSQYLRSLFADVLGRSPEVYDFVVYNQAGEEAARFELDESEFLLLALDSVGDERVMRSLVAAGLTSSTEAALPKKDEVVDPETFIVDQFRRYLGREPSSYELYAFLKEWESDSAVGPTEVVRALVGSREYQSY